MDVLKLHVLLVDEDPTLLETMVDCLNENGFTTDCAQNKEEALKLLEHNSYQVIVTDITMPDNDGIGLAKILGGTMPIVMLKGNDDQKSLSEIDNLICCFLDKSEIHQRLAKATWTAFKRFKIEKRLNREIVAA
jgi:DNA-binding NtrC family response regulator